MSAKIFQFDKQQRDLRAELKKAIGNNAEVLKLIDSMTDAQITAAFEKTQGSLMHLTDRLEICDKTFKKFMADIAEKHGDLLIVCSAINYVLEFCEQVPKQNKHDDEIDNAYQAVLKEEMRSVIEKAIRSVV